MHSAVMDADLQFDENRLPFDSLEGVAQAFDQRLMLPHSLNVGHDNR